MFVKIHEHISLYFCGVFFFFLSLLVQYNSIAHSWQHGELTISAARTSSQNDDVGWECKRGGIGSEK